MTTFYILGQKFVKFFVGFLENIRHQKDILRLTDLYNTESEFAQNMYVNLQTKSFGKYLEQNVSGDWSFGKFFDQNIHWFGRIHEFIFKENLVENTFDTGQFLEKQFCF